MSAKHILVLGAGGFIGSHLVADLVSRGSRVTCAGRDTARLKQRFPSCEVISADLMRDDEESWVARLAGVDAVVNAAGILRGSVERVHAKGPAALFDACARVGVAKVLQISALGAGGRPASRFLSTKAEGDEHLRRLAMQPGRSGWHVVRPSIVVGRGGASTGLFCALAALPFPVRLGPGTWRVQPVHVQDLTRVLVSLLDEVSAPPVVDVAGPEVMSTDQLTAALRGWLGLRPVRPVALPTPLLRLAARAGDVLPGAALSRESLALLTAGNVAGAVPDIASSRVRRLSDALAGDPSYPADLLLARMLPVRSILLACLAVVWLGSGVASLLVPTARAEALLAGLGLSGAVALGVTWSGALLDIGLGLALLRRRGRAAVLALQIAVMGAYTILATVALPGLWLDPFGSLLKNLAVLATSLALLALER